jgi:DNA-binding MarR family transcriptional regulator
VKEMGKRKYVVTLTESEREELERMIQKGRVSGLRIRHAQILLKLDETPANKSWTGERIGEAYGCNEDTVSRIAKRFVEEGMESALNRKPQENRSRKVDGDVEAHVIALACSNPPLGRERWTVRLLRDEVIRLEIADIERSSVNNILKKTNSSRGG